MYLLSGKPGAVTLLQIAWQFMCMLCGFFFGPIYIPVGAYFFLMLVLNSAGFTFTLLYRRGNISPKCFLCFLDFMFVLSGLIFGMPLGFTFCSLINVRNKDFRNALIGVGVKVGISLVFSVPILILIFIVRFLCGRNARLTAIARKYGIEEEGLFQGPRSFKYSELSKATKGFSSNELLGTGGFGSVYKGSLLLKGDPTQIAVKRIAATSDQGAQEFLAEVKIIGQVQHRNLVRLLGWCCEKNELMLVYNYMPNGSVDQYLHKTTKTGEAFLTWARRLSIMNDVAIGLAYLHDDLEQRVVHNDVKSSNVMLDCHFNARLGDFGLARLSEHNQVPVSESGIAGTFGYMAPELFNTQRPTEKSDVYSFGAMVLEVATGKKPLLSAEDRKSLNETFLVDWVWRLYENNALLDAVDCSLQNAHDSSEMTMFLKIGLLCCHPSTDKRPRMREAIHIWKGLIPFPTSRLSKFVPVLGHYMDCLSSDRDVEDDTQETMSSIPNNANQADDSWTRSSSMDSLDLQCTHNLSRSSWRFASTRAKGGKVDFPSETRST